MQWGDWTLPMDGVEILNLDTIWRRLLYAPGWAPKQRLLQALFAYPIRAEEAIGNLLTVSDLNATAYAALVARREATAIVAVDAHSKLALRDVDPGDNRWALPFPGYETVFRTLQVRLTPARPLTGDADVDAALVTDALREGRIYGVNAALAAPPFFEFTAEGPHGVTEQGGVLPAGAPATLRVRSNAPPGFETILFEGPEIRLASPAPGLEMEVAGTPAEYRVEVRAVDRPGHPVWIVSNPIYVRRDVPPAAPDAHAGAIESATLFGRGATATWRVESDSGSRAASSTDLSGEIPILRMEYALADGPPRSQFAALVVDTPGGIAPYDRLALRVRSSRPARLSVQARAAVTASVDDRWVRSVFVDQSWRDVVIDLSDMRPLGPTRTPMPPPASIHSLVFALELTNTAPGAEGEIWIERAGLER
jgi:hypothetical protein